jgi:Icc-related predicted phosphoesterase
MKIFAASDLHGDLELIEELAKKAEEADLVVLCGDLTFAESSLEGLIGPFKKTGKPVLIVPGNHESIAAINFLASLYSPGVYNIHGTGVVFGKVGFFGCGLSDIGFFSMDDSETEKTLLKAHDFVKKARKKVMVTHSPPYDTKLDELGWVKAGSKGIRRAIENLKPDLCLCGHIHETFGFEDKIKNTRIINVGRNGKLLKI